MTMSMADLKSKINLDRSVTEKFVLLLTSMEINDKIKTPLFVIVKTSESTFSFNITENAVNKLVENWVVDTSSPLDFVMGETDD